MKRGTGFAVAVSGGPDSTALLHCSARCAQALGLQVHALHVHHNLQAQADEWLRRLRRRVGAWARAGLPVQLSAHRLSGNPPPGSSIEAWARAERYAALAQMARNLGCQLVLLAHHRRDQAETVLLQLLRGGGAAGLAAMPATVARDGIQWARPWLDQPREAIERYLVRHRLASVLDPSNQEPRFARSRLRALWPTLRAQFPEAEAALVHAATRAQVEADALDEWVGGDLAEVSDGAALRVDAWLMLSPARRSLVLRAWLRQVGAQLGVDALVERLCVELPQAKAARWPLVGGRLLRLYRQRLGIEALQLPAAHAVPASADAQGYAVDLSEPGGWRFASWPGSLQTCWSDDGIDAAVLSRALLRSRRAGDRLALRPGGSAQPLKKLFQQAGVPEDWRDGPVVEVDGQLVYVAGLGMSADWTRRRGAGEGRGVTLSWLRDPPSPVPSGR